MPENGRSTKKVPATDPKSTWPDSGKLIASSIGGTNDATTKPAILEFSSFIAAPLRPSLEILKQPAGDTAKAASSEADTDYSTSLSPARAKRTNSGRLFLRRMRSSAVSGAVYVLMVTATGSPCTCA